jgi:hypothetical protein
MTYTDSELEYGGLERTHIKHVFRDILTEEFVIYTQTGTITLYGGIRQHASKIVDALKGANFALHE